jgi:hypothetical protein
MWDRHIRNGLFLPPLRSIFRKRDQRGEQPHPGPASHGLPAAAGLRSDVADDAFLALGLRRSGDPFQIALMIGCTMLSFQAQRNAWFGVLAALVVIGEAIGDRNGVAADADPKSGWNRQTRFAGGLSVAVVMLAAELGIPRGHEALMARPHKPNRSSPAITFANIGAKISFRSRCATPMNGVGF